MSTQMRSRGAYHFGGLQRTLKFAVLCNPPKWDAPAKSSVENDLKRHIQTASTSKACRVLILLSILRFFSSQVLILHFPGVIQGVKSGMPNQEPERPFRPITGPLAL
jgi:hypothetical protein